MAVLLAGVACLAPQPGWALILSGRGNDPMHDAGWPQGALAVANLKSRLGWWEGPPFGGGEWQFLYRGDTTALNQALTNFAAIRAPALDLVVHDGPEECAFLKDSNNTNSDTRVDWTFTVWVPASWHRLFNNPKSVFAADQPNFRQPVAPPRLDVYIGGGKVDWQGVKVPAGLRVRDERTSASGVNPVGGAVLRADVYDMATGKPVEGARVTALRFTGGSEESAKSPETPRESLTDDLGRAEIAKLPPGTWLVTAAAEGYAPRSLGYFPLGERTFKEVRTELAKTASLSGRVTDTANQALEGVRVHASSTMGIDGRGYNRAGPLEALSDKDGHFELDQLPSGYTQLRARRTGYYFGDIFTIYDLPATNIELRLAQAGTIHVQVRDQAGKPLARLDGHELHVAIEPKGGSKVGSWGGGATVKDDGTVDFKDVPAGEYRITSRPNPATTGKPYAPEQLIQLAPGGHVTVEVIYD